VDGAVSPAAGVLCLRIVTIKKCRIARMKLQRKEKDHEKLKETLI
jgi:hypothetical protein